MTDFQNNTALMADKYIELPTAVIRPINRVPLNGAVSLGIHLKKGRHALKMTMPSWQSDSESSTLSR